MEHFEVTSTPSLSSSSSLTVVFDFDGVIHSYTSGWKGASVVSDDPVPGICSLMTDLIGAGYKIAIVSSRCVENGGRYAIVEWLRRWEFPEEAFTDVSAVKVPGVVYLDDRGMTVDRDFIRRVADAEGRSSLITEIKNFVPWNR